ncbi:Ras GTPase [Pelomyxa schiedti]|nr:Ras GTPase [Pelomyxa schiedti]
MGKTKTTGTGDSFRVVLVGAGGVGKSAMTLALVQNVFVTDYDPTLETAYRKPISVDDTVCMLEILDTAGQDDYAAIREAYFRQGQGFLVVWSVVDRLTFQIAQEMYQRILILKEATKVPVVFCGNKIDMDPTTRVVTEEEGKSLAKTCGESPYLETSAKLSVNIEASFQTVVRTMRRFSKDNKKEGGCCILL